MNEASAPVPVPGKSRKEIVGIQYLRGLAAVAVVLNHSADLAANSKYFGQEWMGGFWAGGAHGVDLFFLISGFIIAVVSLEGLELRPSLSLGSFAWRRFSRIVPIMWLAILSYAALRLLGRGTVAWDDYIRAWFLLPWQTVAPNQLWTLRHEMLFYFFFALAFLAGKRRFWLLGAWFLAPFVYAATGLPASPSDLGASFLWTLCNPVNVEFLAGFALGVLWLKRTRDFSFAMPVSPMLVFILAMLGIIVVSFLFSLKLGSLFTTSVLAVTCFPVVFVGIHVRCRSGWFGSFGEVLGNASFAIYLFHPHFLSAVLGVWAKHWHGTPIGIVVVVTSIVAILFTTAIHYMVEKPLLRAMRQISKGYTRRRAMTV